MSLLAVSGGSAKIVARPRISPRGDNIAMLTTGSDQSIVMLAKAQSLLDLPAELREQIHERLVVKPRDTITMLSNHDCFKSEVNASQPAISRVNQQLRQESLATFYSNDAFFAEVSDRTDLDTALRWLDAIGGVNVARLRHIALCGWTRVPFGHMTVRRWVPIVLDLKDGTIQLEGNATEADQHPHATKAIAGLKEGFRALVTARAGRYFDSASLAGFINGFHGMCVAY